MRAYALSRRDLRANQPPPRNRQRSRKVDFDAASWAFFRRSMPH